MPQAIDYLERFNRKERSILLSHVLGQKDEKVFRLNRGFAKSLEDILKLKSPIPDDAFVAMDFHLDWLQMALYLADRDDSPSQIIPNEEDRLVKANQEDIDLLITFKDEGTKKTHLVLIEAKADTGWTNKQLQSKAKRLKIIFNKNPHGTDFVRPHFVLMSPDESEKIRTENWPDWMKAEGKSSVLWLPLPLRDGLIKVTRCDEKKKPAKNGGHLFISKYKNDRWEKM